MGETAKTAGQIGLAGAGLINPFTASSIGTTLLGTLGNAYGLSLGAQNVYNTTKKAIQDPSSVSVPEYIFAGLDAIPFVSSSTRIITKLPSVEQVNNTVKRIGQSVSQAKEKVGEATSNLDENYIEVDNVEEVNVGLLHAKIGADICKKKYNFTEEMQNAIKYHTVGNENMDLLAKIIFVADKTEEGRNYKKEEKNEQLQKVRELSKIDINEALLYEIDSSLIYTIQKHKLVHTDSILTRNKLLKDGENV